MYEISRIFFVVFKSTRSHDNMNARFTNDVAAQLVDNRPFQELQAVFPRFYDSTYEWKVNNDNGRRFTSK